MNFDVPAIERERRVAFVPSGASFVCGISVSAQHSKRDSYQAAGVKDVTVKTLTHSPIGCIEPHQSRTYLPIEV